MPIIKTSRQAAGKRVRIPLVAILLFSVAVWAQQKPAEPADEEKGTQDLHKATQNPVASLISVPLQNNTNFDIGPLDRTQNVLNIQPVIPMRVSENWNLINRIILPLVYPARLDAAKRRHYGHGRHQSYVLSLAGQATQADLGHGAGLRSAHGHQQSARPGQVERRAVSGRSGSARALDAWCADQQRLEFCRPVRKARSQPDAAPVLHQLQPEKRLVHHVATRHHR